MTVPISPVDLFSILVAAVIFGSVLAALSVAAIIRYSRNEERGNPNYRRSWSDLAIVIFAGLLVLHGMWKAGLFG